ncbi:MAG: hypothetical protein ABI186_01430 [Candidatus Elarobacter sp.]
MSGIARALEHRGDRIRRAELTRGINQRRTNEIDGHHSEELPLLGALGFDSAGFAAGFDSDLESEDDDVFASPEDLDSLGDFESPEDFDSLDDFESPLELPPLSDDDDDDDPLSPFDVLRGRF